MKVALKKMGYLARLHGYVCGDGSANFYNYSYRKPKAHLNIKIDDRACLAKIIEAFVRLDYSPNILEAKGKNGTWFTIQAQREKIVREILSLGPVGSYKWRLPDLPKQQWIREWIIAFFDSDATVTCVNKEITIESVNQTGLGHLRTVLTKKFGVCSYLKFRKNRKIYLLRICGKANLERFYNKIGFYHHRKQKKLRYTLNSYQKYYGESWGHLKARNSEEASRKLTDVFRYRGYFHVRVSRYGSFELGSHNPRAIAKIANTLRHYFGIKCTLSTHDNQNRCWVRISRQSELQKLLLSGLLAKAPAKEAAIRVFLSQRG
ncbi:MAG: LAGLIDADG family homing endonuclease [Candidatus Hadarchaeaceae archaeon]